MPEFEVTLPDRIDTELDRLVEQGEFLNREQAVEELLSLGVSSYDAGEETDPEMNEELFTQALDDQQDPAAQGDQNDPHEF